MSTKTKTGEVLSALRGYIKGEAQVYSQETRREMEGVVKKAEAPGYFLSLLDVKYGGDLGCAERDAHRYLVVDDPFNCMLAIGAYFGGIEARRMGAGLLGFFKRKDWKEQAAHQTFQKIKNRVEGRKHQNHLFLSCVREVMEERVKSIQKTTP